MFPVWVDWVLGTMDVFDVIDGRVRDGTKTTFGVKSIWRACWRGVQLNWGPIRLQIAVSVVGRKVAYDIGDRSRRWKSFERPPVGS